jgi:hypothetical protein
VGGDAIRKGRSGEPIVRFEVIWKVYSATNCRRTADDECRIGQVDDLPTFGRREAVAHRLRRGSQLPGGQSSLNECDRVGQRDRDEVPEADSELLIRTREAIGSLLEFFTGARTDDTISPKGRDRRPGWGLHCPLTNGRAER